MASIRHPKDFLAGLLFIAFGTPRSSSEATTRSVLRPEWARVLSANPGRPAVVLGARSHCVRCG